MSSSSRASARVAIPRALQILAYAAPSVPRAPVIRSGHSLPDERRDREIVEADSGWLSERTTKRSSDSHHPGPAATGSEQSPDAVRSRITRARAVSRGLPERTSKAPDSYSNGG